MLKFDSDEKQDGKKQPNTTSTLKSQLIESAIKLGKRKHKFDFSRFKMDILSQFFFLLFCLLQF